MGIKRGSGKSDGNARSLIIISGRTNDVTIIISVSPGSVKSGGGLTEDWVRSFRGDDGVWV